MYYIFASPLSLPRSMLCEDVVQMVALHIPEEDRCIDIYEVIENEKLLR